MSTAGIRSSIVERGFERGGDGFYFQHRKGRLDMRTLGKIDVDQVVKNTDIETLQEHLEMLCFAQLREDDLRQCTDPMICKLFRLAQYTMEYLLYVQESMAATLNDLAVKYARKKRSVLEKRKELIELRELATALKGQLKARKKSYGVLEEMAREAGSRPAEDAKPTEKIKFFVAGPRGVCVEFTFLNSAPISALLQEATTAFISRRSRSNGAGRPRGKLMYQGKWLREDASVLECGVRGGDTIAFVVDEGSDDESGDEQARAPVSAPASAPSDAGLAEMMRAQSEAYRRMAEEMKAGFEGAIRSIGSAASKDSSPRGDAELLVRVEEKWTRIELSVRQQLDAQTTHYDALLKELLARDRMRPVAGDLEDDNDGNRDEELRKSLAESLSKLNSLQRSVDLSDSELGSLRQKVGVQADEIEALKARLNAAPTVVYRTVAAPPAPVLEKPAPVAAPLPATVAPEPEPVVVIAAEEPIVVEPILEEPVSAPTEVEIWLSSMVKMSTAESFAATSSEVVTVAVTLPASITADDMIFELRKAVADHFAIPLGRAALVLRGAIVMLGMDIEDASFTAHLAGRLASSGELSYQITRGKPVTDAQLDSVSRGMQEQKSVSLDTKDTTSRSPKLLDRKAMQKINKRSWSDDEDEVSDSELESLKHTLGEALSDVSDRESLTSEELGKKLGNLRRAQTKLPVKLSSHLDSFQRSFSGAMASGEDSGSDSYISSDKRAAAVSLKVHKDEFTAKSMESFQSDSSTRSMDMFDRQDDEEQYVLMRSLQGAPSKGVATTAPVNRRFSVSQDPMSSLVVLDAPSVDEYSKLSLASYQTSASSKSGAAKKDRYSSPEETTYFDDETSEGKRGGDDDSFSRVSSYTNEVKSDLEGSREETSVSAATRSSISGADESKTDIDRRRSSNNQTLASAMSDLTSSGLMEEHIRALHRSESKDESIDESTNTRARKSVEFDRDTHSGIDSGVKAAPPTKPARKIETPTHSSTGSRMTPLSMASASSPFADLEEEGEESLVLSESNDAFPFLEESYDDNSQPSVKSRP